MFEGIKEKVGRFAEDHISDIVALVATAGVTIAYCIGLKQGMKSGYADGHFDGIVQTANAFLETEYEQITGKDK